MSASCAADGAHFTDHATPRKDNCGSHEAGPNEANAIDVENNVVATANVLNEDEEVDLVQDVGLETTDSLDSVHAAVFGRCANKYETVARASRRNRGFVVVVMVLTAAAIAFGFWYRNFGPGNE
jgi:hypothetical protein